MACMDQKALQDLGLAYVAYPVLFGSLFVLAIGRLCARLKREREFVLLWRWKSPFRGKSEKSEQSFASVVSVWDRIHRETERTPRAVPQERTSVRRPPEFLRAADSSTPRRRRRARVRAEAADSGGKSVRDALNDALNDEPRRLSMDDRRPERALLARGREQDRDGRDGDVFVLVFESMHTKRLRARFARRRKQLAYARRLLHTIDTIGRRRLRRRR